MTFHTEDDHSQPTVLTTDFTDRNFPIRVIRAIRGKIIMSGSVSAKEPQRGDLFIGTRPPWDGPNLSGVTCRESAFNGVVRLRRQVTPPGFERASERGVTSNRLPRWGLTLLVSLLLLSGCGGSLPREYEPREGDVLFQSLPHAPLVDAIEGMTKSPYSHCGIVAKHGSEWLVLQAIGPVRETPLLEWIERGREKHFAAYRLAPALSPQIPQILTEARKFLGRPYDIHYTFDDEKIYCSELIFKAVKNATGVSLGKIDRLGDLNWKPYEAFIKSIEDQVPLEREMITPRALSEAKELKQVFSNFANPQGGTNRKPFGSDTNQTPAAAASSRSP